MVNFIVAKLLVSRQAELTLVPTRRLVWRDGGRVSMSRGFDSLPEHSLFVFATMEISCNKKSYRWGPERNWGMARLPLIEATWL